MMYTVFISQLAESDLRSIYEYIAYTLQSPQNAEGQIQKIKQVILGLNEMPNRHPPLEQPGGNGETIRCVPADSFHIYYKVDARNRLVNIVRILHRRRDTEKIFCDSN